MLQPLSTGNFIRPHQVKGERTQARTGTGTGSTRRKESEKRQRPKESE